jgi:hypothetical protein
MREIFCIKFRILQLLNVMGKLLYSNYTVLRQGYVVRIRECQCISYDNLEGTFEYQFPSPVLP